ncbi:hypothetical protein A5893_08145 [Pedobacter psychrophilus]|uniref:DEAD/DEAH box helicase n=1 Tax=Pedobacter psychrophilus TaxID=1826909 RepID=A0A179DES7_9SPHI|nr:DEAD/DEAH box helicase [Pedobacter psychrophilus]OAQ39556.1 hypothetical protein A5893_08145 [Pedobacter psychrophilus]
MSDLVDKIESIYNDELLNNLINDLIFNQFYQKFNLSKIPIAKDRIRKAIWLTSILSTSPLEKHKNKAQLISSLIYLQDSFNIDIERASYILFSRIGNLTGTRLLNNSSNDFSQIQLENNILIDSYDSAILLELELERRNKTVIIGEEQILTTAFQKKLWDDIKSYDKIVISAPTSSGKSFIVKKAIKEKILNNDEYFILYVVPTRALINQVSEELRQEINDNDVDIKTVYIHDETGLNFKKIFILTPERCLSLLKERREHEFKIDLIFIDEIQNVEDTQGRGTLFEFVFQELIKLFSEAIIIAAGPNIENPNKLYENIFNIKSNSSETMVSPVFQIKTIVTVLHDKKIRFTLIKNSESSQSFEIETSIDLKQIFLKSTGNGLRELINICGADESNIIYSPKGNWAENWALKYIEPLQDVQIHSEVKDIVEFLEDEVHPFYNLAICLNKGVAFHHGNLPDLVRKEIEDCFLEGKIKILFCTSTLLQGVNLPANNIFIVSPKKRTFPLSSFDFGNLIGRAGRIKDSLFGTVFCIEKSENDEWAESYYKKSPRKEVTTASNSALDNFDDFIGELSKSSLEISSDIDSNGVIFYRQKYLQDIDRFPIYLQNKGLSEEESNIFIENISSSVADLLIPLDILSLNPTIDPILQNILYVQILDYGFENWLIPSISNNRNFYKHISDEEKILTEFKDWSFYLQFNDLLKRLDEIFHFANEAFFKHNISTSINQITYYCRMWLGNKSLRELIDSDLKFYSTHYNLAKRIKLDDKEAINTRINKVIKINSIVTTHIVVKYLKLMNDLVESITNDKVLENYKFSMALPLMLELGTTEPVVIKLISKGISRSISLKIFSEFKKVPNYEEIDIFDWLRSKTELKLKPIYNRYLKKMKLLKYN